METKLNQEQKLWQPSDLKQGMTVWQNTTFYLLTTVCCVKILVHSIIIVVFVDVPSAIARIAA